MFKQEESGFWKKTAGFQEKVGVGPPGQTQTGEQPGNGTAKQPNSRIPNSRGPDHFLDPLDLEAGRALPATRRAIATACFGGRPARISVRMFLETAALDRPFTSGIISPSVSRAMAGVAPS